MGGIGGVFSTALSGLNAAGTILNTAAGNLANLDTPGYKARRPTLSADANGVAVGTPTTDTRPSPPDAEGGEGSNVDPATEVVSLIQAKTLYTANAAVVRAGSELLGTLLDTFDTGGRRGRRHA